MSKRIAKAILPRPMLRFINTCRHDDERIWAFLASKRIERKIQASVLHSRVSRPFAGIVSPSLSPAAVASLIDSWRDLEQYDRISVLKGRAFIEPTGGWIICSPSHLVRDCLIDGSLAKKPSFQNYLEARLAPKGHVRRERRVITLRDWGEANYWHFFNDLVGGRLRMAEACGLDRDIPVLIGRRALRMPFVQECIARTGLGGRRIIVQDEEFVRCDEIVFCETARHSIESMDFVLRFLGAAGGRPSGNRRVLLLRRPTSGRAIENVGAVEDVCRRFDFETVMTEGMTLDEQIRLFADTRYLVAVHGAGLLNIIFRKGAPLGIIELFPATSYHGWDGAPAHYFWLAHALGFQYDAMFGQGGEGGEYRKSFHLDPDQLAVRLQAMCG